MFLEGNRMKKLLCVLLSLVMLVCAFPVSAAEGEFLMFTVAQFCAEENMTQQAETVGYSDGKNLYVPIDFFEAYMPYVFDDESAAFVRSDHMANSKYGRLELDFDAKKAKLYLTPFESNTYDLENVFSFGEQYFLPLAQIAAYLKAAVTVEGTIIHVLNSGYSLADAEYALSVADHSKLLKYDLQAVIDDIYVGSEWTFKKSAIQGYFSSVIFGQRLDKLDFITNLGDIKDYIQFLEKCVTDNDGYINTITEDFNLVERFNLAADVNEKVHSKSQILGDTTEILKTLSEQNKDSSLSDALMYVDARDWNALFDSISKVTDFADYYLKLGSMCEDNRRMLNNFRESGLVTTEDAPFYLAMTNVWGKYGGDVVNKIVTQIGEELVENYIDKAKEAALKEIIPSTKAIKMVATVFKLMGFDLTDNSEYSIMIDLNAVHALKSVYYDDAGHMKNAETAEKYRLAILFWLISVKQTYIAANKLSKKTDGSASLYDDEIEKVQTLIDLFYAAAQSKNIDSFTGLENLKSINEKAIRESSILSAAEKVSEEKALQILTRDKIYAAEAYKHQYNLNYAAFDYDENYIVRLISSKKNFDGYAIQVLNKSDGTVISTIDLGIGTERVGIYEDYIYYASYGILYRRGIDGTNRTKIIEYQGEPYTDNASCNFIFYQDKIIVNDAGGNLYVMQLDGSDVKTVDNGVNSAIFTYENDLYYQKNEQLLKVNLDNLLEKKIIIDDFVNVQFHSINGDTLYYLSSYNSPLLTKDFISSVEVGIWKKDLTDSKEGNLLLSCPQSRMWQYEFLMCSNVVYAQDSSLEKFGTIQNREIIPSSENPITQSNIFIGYIDNKIVGFPSFSPDSKLETLHTFS